MPTSARIWLCRRHLAKSSCHTYAPSARPVPAARASASLLWAVQPSESMSVLIKSTYRADEAERIAWDNGVPIIDEDADLARALGARRQLGPVTGRLEGSLGRLWRTHQYVPTDATLASYVDLKTHLPRVGFVVNRREHEVDFIPLALTRRDPMDPSAKGFEMETVRRADVRQGGQRLGLTAEHLKESSDFLDYCVYDILRALSAEPERARYVRLAIAPTKFDATKMEDLKRRADSYRARFLEELRIREKGKRRPRVVIGEDGMERLAAMALDAFLGEASRKGEREARAILMEYEAEEARLAEIQAEAGKVTTELRTRLRKAKVSLVEREQLETIEMERDRWNRSDFQKATEQKLLGASHFVFAELRDRRGEGQYHLSTRLVDTGTGEIVTEEEGERTPRERDEPLPTDMPYLLNTGRLVLLEFQRDRRPRTEGDLRSYRAGLPLRLPALSLVEKSDDDRTLKRNAIAC